MNASQLQSLSSLENDSTGFWMGCLTPEANGVHSFSLCRLASSDSRRECYKVHLCAVCPESSGALTGLLGKNLHT